ncbi:MAG: trypsin-like peptidase domain-containing protein [Acutalibacteraceae bacterium]|nr:trypsin-like peptidase domain-containing protein [Acutalibacteraceae bacterium]
MKSLKVLLSLLVVMAILLATSLHSFAIDFVAEDIYESVFVVYSGNSLGSGFSIGKDCIVTNAHVIDQTDDVVIKSYSGEEYSAFVVGINQEEDIAILGVDGVGFPYLTVADSSTINTGDDIYAIGAPKSMAYTLTKGVISAKSREVKGSKYIQIDAPINEGNSGGPLLNAVGQVIGINTLKMIDSEGIGLAIPMEVLRGYLVDIGLELDEKGNVISEVTSSESSNNATEAIESEDDESKEKTQDSKLMNVISLIATLSIICNIILSVLLVHKKKKNLDLKCDPRERTDFDIEILE